MYSIQDESAAMEILATADARFDFSDAAREWNQAAEGDTLVLNRAAEPTTKEMIAQVAPKRCPQCGEELLVLDAGNVCMNEWCDTVWA
jgi:hypothetical protein